MKPQSYPMFTLALVLSSLCRPARSRPRRSIAAKTPASSSGSTGAPALQVAGSTFHGRQLSIVAGRLIEQEVEAIVHQVNSEVFHDQTQAEELIRAVGGDILQELRACCPFGCSQGQAVATGVGRLKPPVRHMIHVMSPVWRGGGHGEVSQLEDAYHACLSLAESIGLSSVAFPPLSMGNAPGAFPIDRAAETATSTILAFLRRSQVVRYVAIVPAVDRGSCLIGAYSRVLSLGAGSVSQGA